MFFWCFKFHHHLAESTFSVYVFLIEMFFKRRSCFLSTSVLVGCFLLLFTATHSLLLLSFCFSLVTRGIPIAINHVFCGRNFLPAQPADINILTNLWWMHVWDVAPDLAKYPPTPRTLDWYGFLTSMGRVHVLQETIVWLLQYQSPALKTIFPIGKVRISI